MVLSHFITIHDTRTARRGQGAALPDSGQRACRILDNPPRTNGNYTNLETFSVGMHLDYNKASPIPVLKTAEPAGGNCLKPDNNQIR
jgi:hypothetical protein